MGTESNRKAATLTICCTIIMHKSILSSKKPVISSWEMKLAIQQGILLNVDSVFDAKMIATIAAADFPDKNGKLLKLLI